MVAVAVVGREAYQFELARFKTAYTAAVAPALVAFLFFTATTFSIQRQTEWVYLCGASGIVTSVEDQVSHAPPELDKQIGKSMGRVLRTDQSDRDFTEILAKLGHGKEATECMVRVARKYGYVLWFPEYRRFDPRRKPSWFIEKPRQLRAK